MLSVTVLIVVLFLGLIPKDFLFSNSVSRIENQAGIRFEKYGLAYTDPIKELSKDNGFGESGFSIEIALKPSIYQEGFNFILTLHNGDDRKQFYWGSGVHESSQ